MTSFEHDPDLPDVNALHRPNFSELLGRLQNGTLSEVTTETDSGAQVVFVDNKPQLESEAWADPSGNLVRSFSSKFEDGFEGWQPGEIVNARFVLTRKHGDGRLGLLVSDAYVGDIRNADTFVLPELDEEDETLRNIGMALIDADVEVTSTGSYRVSNMFDYEARLHRVNSIQAPWDGENTPQIGEQVLVQGEVVTYIPGEADYKNASFPVVEVRLPNGRTVPIEMTNGHIDYESGNLDFSYPEGIQEGDIVQINATFSNTSPNWREHKDRPATLHAPFCRSAFLLQPNAERLTTYEAHRADIAARLSSLATLDGPAFRSAYAELMQTYIELGSERRKWPRLLLTDREKSQIKQLTELKFPNGEYGNPSPEKPLTDVGHISQMVNISKGYGVDVFGMSRSQYYAFCLDIANRRILADPNEETSVDYPFWILSLSDDKFSAQEQFEVYRRVAENWLPHIKGKDVVHRSEELTDPERQVNYDDQYLAGRAIEFMSIAAEKLPEARDYLYNLTVQTLRARASEDVQRTRRSADSMLPYTLCTQLRDLAAKSAVWDMNKGWVGVKDPAGLSYFVDRQLELQAIAMELDASANDNNWAREVYELVTKISELNALPLYTDPAG